MKDLWFIAAAAGLRDGLNPCIFMTCAVFIALGLWLKISPVRAGWLRLIFALIYALTFLGFNFGPGQMLLFHKNFILTAKVLYLILGIGAFILGIVFIKEWYLLRFKDKTNSDGKGISSRQDIKLQVLLMVVLGIGLSALSTLWPINNYMMLLGNEALLKGQWSVIAPLLTCYVLLSMWPLWFVWAFLDINDLRPSLSTIFCAAIFFTASTVMILIFK